jgi:hypothetical protein
VHNHKHPNIQKGRLLGDCIDTLSHAQMFLKFFPLHVFEPLVPKWQHDAKSKESPQSGMPEITMSLFVGWLALWVAMMVVHLPSRDMYWNSLQDAIYNCPLFHEWGLHRYFEELLSVFSLPEYGPDDPQYLPEDPLQSVRKWYDLLAAYWHSSYKAGTILVVDESMVFWTGQGVHLTYLPRKPTPVGVI